MAVGLIIIEGPGRGQTFTLGPDPIIIGREAQAAKFVIADAAVSRRHARISREGDQHAIEDLRSTNGTFVNGERVVGAVRLVPGDLIGLGTAVMLSYEDLDLANVTMLALNQGKVAEMVDDIAERDYFRDLKKRVRQIRRKPDSADPS